MNSLTVKILAGLVSVLMLTTICTQVYYAVHDKHDTQEAVLTSINEDIPFQGVIIRNEKVVTYNGQGVIDYQYADGNKVSVNDAVAKVYDNKESVIAKNKINLINEEITSLKRAQNPGTTNYVEPETIKNKIKNQYKKLLSYSTNGDLSELKKVKSELNLVMNIYNIVTNSEKNYNEKIALLNKEKSELQKKASKPTGTRKADETGYFVSYADGYENKLNIKNADKLTEKDINDVVNGKSEKPENAIGKLFDDYSCRIAMVVKADSRITEDAQLQMVLDNSKVIYDVTVESVKPCGNNDEKMIVILSCDRIDSTLVDSRVISAQLIFDEYSGLKVPREAIRFQGSQKGVYVILGKDISFKKIDVIYEGDDYVLSRNTSDESYLLLYDQILLEVVSNKNVSESSKSDSTDTSAG